MVWGTPVDGPAGHFWPVSDHRTGSFVICAWLQLQSMSMIVVCNLVAVDAYFVTISHIEMPLCSCVEFRGSPSL